MHSGRSRLLVLVMSLVLVVAGCSHSADNGSKECQIGQQLVPGCGVLLGVTPETPRLESLDASEASLGRPVDFVYRFHSLDDADVPSTEERAIVDSGRLLHYSFDTVATDPSSPAHYSWAQISAGDADTELIRLAQGVASLQEPVWVTFDHEADQPARNWQGTGEEFQTAWRHVRDVFNEHGADNAVWTWVVMGGEDTFDRATSLWPGPDAVDWISWEAYDPGGCRINEFDEQRAVSFEHAFRPFYRWYKSAALGPGGTDLPIMLSEVGSSIRPDNRSSREQWYRDIPGVLKRYPQVKAIGLWDHTGNESCDYRFGAADPSISLRGILDAEDMGRFSASRQ